MSQTPQVDLDCISADLGDVLVTHWDANAAAFAPGLLEALFEPPPKMTPPRTDGEPPSIVLCETVIPCASG